MCEYSNGMCRGCLATRLGFYPEARLRFRVARPSRCAIQPKQAFLLMKGGVLEWVKERSPPLFPHWPSQLGRVPGRGLVPAG